MKSNLTLPFGVLMALLAGGAPAQDTLQDSPPAQALPLEELQVFAEAFGKIKSEYVDQVDDATLLRDAVRGMLAGLDPHSEFLDPEAFEEMRFSNEGKFGGIGLEVAVEDGYLTVVAPFDDTPAQRAGIRSGDIIVRLDGVPVPDMGLEDAVERMRGPAGSEIILTISRRGVEEVFDVKLVRAVIALTGVKGEMLEEGFGYLRITNFQSGTGDNLRAKIGQLERENRGKLRGFVLDLRDNPGGVLHSAVEVSDVFLDSGLVVSTRGRNVAANDKFSAISDDITAGAALVALVNSGSASAAEIVAGALQDQRRAIILGTRTFGKGSVQTVIPMNNGGALKLTTARYYTPSNRSIQARGIVPDIIVEQLEPPAVRGGEAAQLETAIRESDLFGHLENDRAGGDDANADTAEEAGETGGKAQSALVARDYQVSEALNLLKGMSLVRLQDSGVRNGDARPASGEG